MSRDPLLFLEDMETVCQAVLEYTQGVDQDSFFSDLMRFEAVLYNLQVLGEAAKRVPPALRDRHPSIAWREIAGMRDFVAHAYFALDRDILWSAIQDDVPRLHATLKTVVPAERARSEQKPPGEE